MFWLTSATDNLSKSNAAAIKLHLINLLDLSGILCTHLSIYFSLKFANSLCNSLWFRLRDLSGCGAGINDNPFPKRDRLLGVNSCLAKLVTFFRVVGWVT